MAALVQIDRICLSDVQVATLRASLVTMIKTMAEPIEGLDAESQMLISGYIVHATEILKMVDAR